MAQDRPCRRATIELLHNVQAGEGGEDAVFSVFKRCLDRDFCFTDCTSFSVMRSLKLKRAFAFDKHFDQFEGISRLP